MNALNGVWSDLHPAAHNPTRITKADKGFSKRIDFKDIELPVKVRDLHKIEKKNSVGILVISVTKKLKIFTVYIKKICSEYKHVNLLMIGKKDKRRCAL